MHDTTDITDDVIRALRQEADLHADHAQVLICDAALGVQAAIEELPTVGFRRAPGPWVRGWHLDGAGPARHGWARMCASGRWEYLGRTVAEIARAECARVKDASKAMADDLAHGNAE